MTIADLQGLNEAEAKQRLLADGPNELPGAGQRSFLKIVLDVLREPMLLLLLAAGAIYLLLGDLHEAVILSGFVCLTIGIAIVQESRTERAIDSLRNLAMPQALVIREGKRRLVPSRELVRGDVVVIEEGGRIAADGWVVRADNLQADESILTGESVAVSKRAMEQGEAVEPPLPGGDGLPYAYSGTLAVRGNGLLRVAATGTASRIGSIGQSLAMLETETPRLTLQTRTLVRWFAFFGISVSVLAILLYGILRGGWLEAALSGIAIAMSMLPEELPVVLTLFMTMGALRMSKNRVLARRGAAIETLGAATVLCTDKTGTLTLNRMEIAELRLPTGESFLAESDGLNLHGRFADLADLGILASLEQPFDPMEMAFHALAGRHPEAPLRARQGDGWILRHQYALSPDLLAVSHVWGQDGGSERVVATKGAPEAIAELCGLTGVKRSEMDRQVAEMAARGLRVLGVAEARWEGEDLPETQRHFSFTFRGLVGLADPVRGSVPGAVRELQEAGIRVVMITGDYPVTARAIAQQAGIEADHVMTGEQVAAMDDDRLAAEIRDVSIFARVMPEQKLRLVRALKDAGEIVAMTGDGVNDAPSLKAAHIGIAMGQRGTDVAREASSIVLLDDDFSSIVSAVRLGRRIYDNLRKASGFIFAVHVPIGGLALSPLLLGWPLILGPIHIALLEMVVDPVCSLAYEAEPEEPDVMQRPPRHPDSPLITRSLLAWSAVQGLLALVLLLTLAFWAIGASASDAAFHTTCFAGLIATVLALVFSNRSFGAGKFHMLHHKHNRPLIVILGIVAMIFSALFLAQPVADLFGFSTLGKQGMAAVGVYLAALVLGVWAAKRHFRPALVR